ncbi:MAG: hypothetical protein ACRC37_07490, partial [Lentisphaeria bacterium]
FAFILASLLLPLFQILNSSLQWNLPNYLAASGFFILMLFYLFRFFTLSATFKKALHNLAPIFLDQTMAVLFRCNDQEIKNFAKLKPLNVISHLSNLKKTKLRWQVIFHRFAHNNLEVDK